MLVGSRYRVPYNHGHIEINMSIIDSISLFAIMIILAIIPSTSVAFVITRSVTLGIANGIAGALGIVLGDIVFILLAVLGLSMIAESMAGLFLVIKYMGGSYLLWLGYSLLKSKKTMTLFVNKPSKKSSLVVSFFAGLVLTLGDIKAILFYASLFPTFVSLESLKTSGLMIIILVTMVTVGGVKIAYVFSARKIVSMSQHLKLETSARKLAGSFMIGAGSYLIVKT